MIDSETGLDLPRHVWRVIQHCRHGERLCKVVGIQRGDHTQPKFFLEPSNRQITNKAAEEAIATGLLRPGHDGLFEDFNQTWGIQ